MLTVAVVGAGRMGRIRAIAARDLGAKVVAICDEVSDRADLLANEVNGHAVTDFQNLPWDRLDAVFVCTPPNVRQDVAINAIESKVHLFIEKPVGLSACDGEVLLRALDRSPVVTAVGYMNRYRPSVQHVRQAVQDERILGFVAYWAGRRYAVPWWDDPARSGGPINEQCTHVIDLCRYLVGEVSSIQVLAADAVQPSLSAMLGIRFDSGALGSVFYSCEAQEKMISVRVITEQRDYRLEGWDLTFEYQRDDRADEMPVFLRETDAFLREIRRWHSGHRGTAEALVFSDLRDAVRTQRVVDEVLHSTRGGQPAAPQKVM